MFLSCPYLSGHLAVTVPDNIFTDLVKGLIKNIEDPNQKGEKLHTYLSAIEAISRSVGYRFVLLLCIYHFHV